MITSTSVTAGSIVAVEIMTVHEHTSWTMSLFTCQSHWVCPHRAADYSSD